MAVALSYTRDQIINAALLRVRAIAEGATGNASQLASAAIILNGLLKNLDGVPTLTAKRDVAKKNVAIAAGDKSVTLSANAVFVEGAQYINGTTNTVHTLKPMTRVMWLETKQDKATPDRDTPTHIYVTNNGGTKVAYIYPSPATTGSIDYWSRDQIDVFDTANDTSDLPDKFTIWLIYQLAADLGFDYQMRLEEIAALQGRADTVFQIAMAGEGGEQEKDVTSEELPLRRTK